MRIAIVAPTPALRAGLRMLLTRPDVAQGSGSPPDRDLFAADGEPLTVVYEAGSLDALAALVAVPPNAAPIAVDVLVITAGAASGLGHWLAAVEASTGGVDAAPPPPAVLLLSNTESMLHPAGLSLTEGPNGLAENAIRSQAAGYIRGEDHALLAQRVQNLRQMPLRSWGILPLDASAEELRAAVQALYEGLVVIDHAIFQLALLQPEAGEANEAETVGASARPDSAGRSGAEASQGEQPLTERESQVLQLVARGLANKQIAAVLGISEHTVKFHVSSIYAKLGAINRAEAVRAGVQRGLVSL